MSVSSGVKLSLFECVRRSLSGYVHVCLQIVQHVIRGLPIMLACFMELIGYKGVYIIDFDKYLELSSFYGCVIFS